KQILISLFSYFFYNYIIQKKQLYIFFQINFFIYRLCNFFFQIYQQIQIFIQNFMKINHSFYQFFTSFDLLFTIYQDP
ncbi:hypothetical protein IMG5_073640, partial [Ichthyophthirius multifiliis]